MADPKSAALPLGDAPNWSGPSIGSNKRTGRSESARSWTPVAALTRHGGLDTVPQLVDGLAQQHQGADHGDADQQQDQAVLRIRLAGLLGLHRAHPRAAPPAGDPPSGRFYYGNVRRLPPAESVSTPPGSRAKRLRASSAPSASRGCSGRASGRCSATSSTAAPPSRCRNPATARGAQPALSWSAA